MKHKRRLYVFIIVLFVVALPFALNEVLLIPRFCDVVGDSITWLNFWPIYLSSIASFGMITLTYWMLKQSKEQMLDIQKQRDEEQRARLVFSIIVNQQAFFVRIANIGKQHAYNVILHINDEFINLIEPRHQCLFTDLSNPFFIEANNSIYIFMGFCEVVNASFKDKDVTLSIEGRYNDRYDIHEEINIQQFVNKSHFIVKSSLEFNIEYMKKGLVVQNDLYYPVQKSLDIIAKGLSKYFEALKEKDEKKNTGRKRNQTNNISI